MAVFDIACQVVDTVVLDDETVLNETRKVQACSQITAGPNLFLDTGADVTLRTGGSVIFESPFQVLSGAKLTVVNAPPN